MKTIGEIFKVSPKDGEVGIEIEMEGRGLFPPESDPDAARYWRHDIDNSLRGEALEYILIEPLSRSDATQALVTLKDMFNRRRCKLTPSDRCGVHVHINVQSMTFKQVVNFLVLYFIFEDLLVKWCGEDREGNLFCLRAKDAEYIVTFLLRSLINNNGAIRWMHEGNLRYASANIAALQKYGSLEFRAKRTTTDLGEIDTWMRMLLAVKDASLAYNETYEIVEGLSAMDVYPFMRQVFKGYAELLQCSNMDRLVMDGVRRVQDLAYLPQIVEARSKDKKNKKKSVYDVDLLPSSPTNPFMHGSPAWFAYESGQGLGMGANAPSAIPPIQPATPGPAWTVTDDDYIYEEPEE